MKKTLGLLVVALIAVVLVGCNKNKTTAAKLEAKKDYTYKTYSTSLGNNWNPHTWETSADSSILSYLSIGFVDLSIKDSEEGLYQWVYEMAESITDVTEANQADLTKYGSVLPTGVENVSEVKKGYVFEFKLNKNAKWQNGEAINADTYIYSMQQLLDSKMHNYRANLYISGESALVGAEGYYNSEAPIYSAVLDAVEEYIPEANLTLVDGKYQAAIDDNNYVMYTSSSATMPFFGAPLSYYYEQGYTSYYLVPYTGTETDPANYPDYVVNKGTESEPVYKTDFYKEVKAKENAYGYAPIDEELLADIIACAANFGDPNSIDWNEMAFYNSGVGEKVEWSTVGLYKVDDYTFRYVLNTQQDFNYFLTSCTDTWLVYKAIYEGGFDTTGELKTTNYGTSVETSMSYGPYKLESYQDGKQMVFVQNENWYGYQKKENGALYSETQFNVNGKKVQQYQTTKIVIDVMTDAAAKQKFLSGDLDDWTPSSEELSTYSLSSQLYKVDETYTMSFFFNTNVTALQAMDSSKGNVNSVVLSNDNFRKAFSLGINRAEWVGATAGYKPAYSLLNSLYYYNVYEDPNSIYRNTDQAMNALVNLYGVEYGADKTYKTLKEAHDSINGYNLTEAKNLMKTACEELVQAGLYTAGQEIKIKVGYKKGALDSDDNKQIELMNKYINAAIEGSGFGKITLEAVGNITDRYGAVPAGDYAIGYGAWGGAAFYPFRNFQVYCDSAQYDINEAACWDPATEMLTLNVKGTDVTMSYKDWSNCMIGTGAYANADFETKLDITAKLEEKLLGFYYRIPLAVSTSCSMLSYKMNYFTEDYNIMYGFGGLRLMTYNYDDAAWATYVDSQNGVINYN